MRPSLLSETGAILHFKAARIGLQLIVAVLVYAAWSAALVDAPLDAVQSVPQASPENGPGIRSYANGVRIDWGAKEVLLDAKVVLREGPLELLACSPQTREHESILVVAGRPLHIYQAMGLVGLQPGSAVRFNEQTEKWEPASGDRLEILVRYRHEGDERSVRAEEWLENVKTEKPPADLEWVFAGSVKSNDGGLGADSEGTVVCVVDFPTAIISPRELHTTDNQLLWLRARTEVIPPVGAPCTLVIRAASPREAGGVEKSAKPPDNAAPNGSDNHENPD